MRHIAVFLTLVSLSAAVSAVAQESADVSGETAATAVESAQASDDAQPGAETGSTASPSTQSAEPPVTAPQPDETASDAADRAAAKIDGIAKQVDQNEQARNISAGILQPIYFLAESFSYPSFYWAAFAVMVAGVVNFALQLVLGKLVVLTKLGFSITEILSDAFGLLISVFGLVLTTQAAVQNSDFTSSAFAVISATAAGAVVGLIFYSWGQRLEMDAATGRRGSDLKKN